MAEDGGRTQGRGGRSGRRDGRGGARQARDVPKAPGAHGAKDGLEGAESAAGTGGGHGTERGHGTGSGHGVHHGAREARLREYRMEELARLAGITVRTLRFYRERRLIPPPRREGRIAWYDEHHLARLRTIAALLERGHTLNGIAELAEALDQGRDVADLLGVGAPTEEEPVRLTPEELAARFEGEVTPENLAAAMELGYLGTDGDEIVHISRRLLDVSSALVREGIPLGEVLDAAARVREHADALAELFAGVILRHAGEEDLHRLRPLARSVVEAELSLALDRRLGRRNPEDYRS